MKLYNGDCLDVMEELPAGSVDLILCDPPYGVTRNPWDKKIPTDRLWGGVNRLRKADTAILFFAQMPFAAELVMSNPRMFRYEWIWQKSNVSGFLNAKRMPLKSHENILVFYEALPTYNPQMTPGLHMKARSGRVQTSNYGKFERMNPEIADSYYPRDILSFPCVNQGPGVERFHPTQKPVPLLEYLIKTYSNPGDVVFDPCMGAGSTGVAAINTGRNFVGIELDSGYYQVAQARIEQARKDRAFAEAQIKIDV